MRWLPASNSYNFFNAGILSPFYYLIYVFIKFRVIQMGMGVNEFVLIIQSVITSHTCVAPRFVVAAYGKNTPQSSPSSRLGLLCSDTLYSAFLYRCV